MKKIFAGLVLLVAFLPGLATAGGVTTPALPSVNTDPVAPPVPSNNIAVFGGVVAQAGWNLIGNPLNRSLSMAEMFGSKDSPLFTAPDQNNGGTVNVTYSILSVWSWDTTLNNWVFYSPQLTSAENKAYADSKGYGVLSIIAPGQGFWVSCRYGVWLPKIIDQEYSGFYSDFANLQSGWNLLGASRYVSSASDYNRRVNGSSTTVSGGSVPVTNMRSLWTWEPGSGKWAFYSPVAEAEQLANGDGSTTYKYANDKGYWDATYWSLNSGQGFWVNKL